MKQIKEKAPDVVPFAIGKVFIPSDNFDYPVANGLPFVIDLEGDTTKVVNRYEVPRFKEHLKTLHKFYEAGYIPKMSQQAILHLTFNKILGSFVKKQ